MSAVNASVRTICFAALLVMAACSQRGNERIVVGSALPPGDFGLVQAKKSCPVPLGSFAWPNQRDVSAAGAAEYRYQAPWNGDVPVAAGPRMLMRIARRTDGSVEISGIPLPYPVGRPNQRTGERAMARVGAGSSAVYAKNKFSCVDGMASFEPVEVLDLPEIKNFGGKGLMRGVRLAMLEDGSLAVGLKNISTGHSSSLFSWGGQSFGPDFRAADQVYWHWKRFDPAKAEDLGKR